MTYEEQKRWLQMRGFIVGKRDPLMNTTVTGDFMVSDPYPAGYTQLHGADAAELWCLVGDSLPELVADAFSQFHDGSQYVDPE